METNIKERKAGTAVNLSLVVPGLGQIYCGDLCLGLIYMTTYTATLASMMLGIATGAGGGFILGLLLAGLGIGVLSAVGAYRMARRTRPDYRLKEYNRGLIYVLLFLCTTGGAVGIALLIRENFFSAFAIPNSSMYPTLQAGDRLLAEKNVYEKRDPERGELVIFRPPTDRSIFYVKRIIGIAGDVLQQKDGQLTVNGTPVPMTPSAVDPAKGIFVESIGDSEHLVHDDEEGTKGDFPAITVPDYHVFVMGDNRDHSRDSRHFGPISISACLGRASYLFWSSSDWKRIGQLE